MIWEAETRNELSKKKRKAAPDPDPGKWKRRLKTAGKAAGLAGVAAGSAVIGHNLGQYGYHGSMHRLKSILPRFVGNKIATTRFCHNCSNKQVGSGKACKHCNAVRATESYIPESNRAHRKARKPVSEPEQKPSRLKKLGKYALAAGGTALTVGGLSYLHSRLDRDGHNAGWDADKKRAKSTLPATSAEKRDARVALFRRRPSQFGKNNSMTSMMKSWKDKMR